MREPKDLKTQLENTLYILLEIKTLNATIKDDKEFRKRVNKLLKLNK
jgi:hypothetical protein